MLIRWSCCRKTDLSLGKSRRHAKAPPHFLIIFYLSNFRYATFGVQSEAAKKERDGRELESRQTIPVKQATAGVKRLEIV